MKLMVLRDVTFCYADETVPVFEKLNLEVEAGQCLIVKGDNGSGKTTLFRILNGLAFPQEGTYVFDGEDITRKHMDDNAASKRFHQRVGYLFQNPDIMLFNGRVYDEVAFGPRQMGLPEKTVEERTRDCMELLGVTALADKAPYHLSGGQKKRVALASVLALNPEVLILDEPFAGLDAKTKEFLQDFLLEWKAAGKTLIIATHDPQLADLLGDAVLQL